jgi:hypothetical protein
MVYRVYNNRYNRNLGIRVRMDSDSRLSSTMLLTETEGSLPGGWLSATGCTFKPADKILRRRY